MEPVRGRGGGRGGRGSRSGLGVAKRARERVQASEGGLRERGRLVIARGDGGPGAGDHRRVLTQGGFSGAFRTMPSGRRGRGGSVPSSAERGAPWASAAMATVGHRRRAGRGKCCGRGAHLLVARTVEMSPMSYPDKKQQRPSFFVPTVAKKRHDDEKFCAEASVGGAEARDTGRGFRAPSTSRARSRLARV